MVLHITSQLERYGMRARYECSRGDTVDKLNVPLKSRERVVEEESEGILEYQVRCDQGVDIGIATPGVALRVSRAWAWLPTLWTRLLLGSMKQLISDIDRK